MRKRFWPFAAALFALALVAAACGDDTETVDSADGGEETTDTEAMEAMEDGEMADGEMEDGEMAMEDGEHGDGEHGHGDGIEVPDGMDVPQISISAEADTVSGHNLFIDVADFTIAPESASTDPVDGEGHLHLYINGERKLRFYNTALQLKDLPAGEHQIMVEVSANNHSAYTVDGDPITAMTMITVEESEGDDGGHGGHGDAELFESAAPPAIDISISEDPKSGWNLFADVSDFTFAPENVGREAADGEGHLHLYIDGERITRLYGPWWHISGLEAGDHEVMVEVSGNDHSTYGADGEPVMAMTTLTVTEAQAMLSGGHGDDDSDGGHSHSGDGETLDIAAADADVVIEASLVDGELEIEDRRFSVETDQTVGIVFSSDAAEQLHLHGYDILSDVGPDQDVNFAFLADSPGTFEVELEGSGRFLFEIQVR